MFFLAGFLGLARVCLTCQNAFFETETAGTLQPNTANDLVVDNCFTD